MIYFLILFALERHKFIKKPLRNNIYIYISLQPNTKHVSIFFLYMSFLSEILTKFNINNSELVNE